MGRLKLATAWLGGCSGCHMSFLDLDEFLIDLAERADIVYSPIIDVKEYPEGVDVALVEGAVANEEHVEMICTESGLARTRPRLVRRLCGNGQRHALRNPLGSADAVLRPVVPGAGRRSIRRSPPSSRDRAAAARPVRPVHAVVPVDVYLPGCPPPAARIRAVLERLLAGGAGAPRGASDQVWVKSPGGSEVDGVFGTYSLRMVRRFHPILRSRAYGASTGTSRNGPHSGRCHGTAHRHRPGDADRGAREDHHRARTTTGRSPTRGSTSPSFAASREFCEGRPLWEMAGITARVCGICPVSHLIASAQGGRPDHGA